MKLDFLLPASPTPGFFSQIAFFRICLNALGGVYRDARVVAVFGDHETEDLPGAWRNYFDDIDIEWAHPVGAVNVDHQAQHDRRFEIIRKEADLAILCDADIAMLRPFDGLAGRIVDEACLAGVIAHLHFPWAGRSRDPDVDWPELADAILGRPIARPNRYTLMPLDTPPAAPFYINYGVFAGPPALMAEFHKRDLVIRQKVADVLGHWWAPQVSVSLTCEDLKIPTLALPMRYNYPNDPIADTLYPEETVADHFPALPPHDALQKRPGVCR